MRLVWQAPQRCSWLAGGYSLVGWDFQLVTRSYLDHIRRVIVPQSNSLMTQSSRL